MIRGISRQIIEVQETGNVYYERAYLVVKPEYASAEREILEKEARKILKQMDAPSGMKRLGNKWKWTLRLGICALAAAAAMALCLWLL